VSARTADRKPFNVQSFGMIVSMSRDANNRDVQEQLPAQRSYPTRRTKFTPENIRQIVNLVDRGKSKEQIAEVIGVTLGSLQVTCSKLGISLRQPRFDAGTGVLRRRQSRRENGVSSHGPLSHSVATAQHGTKEQDDAPVKEDTMKEVEPSKHRREHEAKIFPSANFMLTMRYKRQERTSELPLSQDMIGRLALEAEFRRMRIGELITQLIVAAIEKDMFRAMLDENSGSEILQLRTSAASDSSEPVTCRNGHIF
jgi:hypothetical protein